MKLSKRLQAIYDMVCPDLVLADIGCDHAYLPCALILNNKLKRAYACDVAREPLNQAKKTIQYYKLEKSIETVLCDGFDALNSDVQQVVIAGMGYESIKAILMKATTLAKYKQILVQSNRDVDKLRKFISDQGYCIRKESCVKDGHFYQIIVFDALSSSKPTPKELMFGVKMHKNQDYYAMWKQNKRKLEHILNHMPSHHPNYNALSQRLAWIEEELKTC